MKINKKLILSLGTIATTIAPIATVISCGGKSGDNHKIPYEAYKDKVLPKGFKLPEGTTTISADAFSGATLPEGFKLPDTVTVIWGGAFDGATFKGDFEIPSSVTEMGNYIFSEAKFEKNITFNANIKKIPGGTFYGVDLSNATTFKIPSSINSIGQEAFHKAKLPKGFVVPSSVYDIGYLAFNEATLYWDFNIEGTSVRIHNWQILTDAKMIGDLAENVVKWQDLARKFHGWLPKLNDVEWATFWGQSPFKQIHFPEKEWQKWGEN